MKIKVDFVTNSSSTAYVVLVPTNFILKREEAEKYWGTETDNKKSMTDEQFSDVVDTLEELRDGRSIWQYGGEGTPTDIYYVVLEACNRNGFIVSDSEMGGEGNNTTFGVKQEQVTEILSEHIDVNKLLTIAKKGVEICYEK